MLVEWLQFKPPKISCPSWVGLSSYPFGAFPLVVSVDWTSVWSPRNRVKITKHSTFRWIPLRIIRAILPKKNKWLNQTKDSLWLSALSPTELIIYDLFIVLVCCIRSEFPGLWYSSHSTFSLVLHAFCCAPLSDGFMSSHWNRPFKRDVSWEVVSTHQMSDKCASLICMMPVNSSDPCNRCHRGSGVAMACSCLELNLDLQLFFGKLKLLMELGDPLFWGDGSAWWAWGECDHLLTPIDV